VPTGTAERGHQGDQESRLTSLLKTDISCATFLTAFRTTGGIGEPGSEVAAISRVTEHIDVFVVGKT